MQDDSTPDVQLPDESSPERSRASSGRGGEDPHDALPGPGATSLDPAGSTCTDRASAGADTNRDATTGGAAVTVSGANASADAQSPPSVGAGRHAAQENMPSASDAQLLEGAIIRAATALHSTRYRLIKALAEYDRTGAWAFSGSHTCAHWAADRLGVHVGTAREWLRIGHALESLPVVDGALGEGSLSYCAVRSLTRVVVDHPDHEEELVELAQRTAPRDLSGALAGWALEHDSDEDRRRRERRDTYFSARVAPDGMGSIRVRLPAIAMGRVQAAVDAKVMQSDHRDSEDRHPSLGFQRAMALIELVAGRGEEGEETDSGIAGSTPGSVLTEVILHVRSDGCSMHDGTPIAESQVASMVDRAFLRALIHDAADRPVNASTRRRHPTVRQKRVVDERDRRCVDCGSTELLQYDHVPEYSLTGRTHTDELFLRCPRCHRRRHEHEGGPPPE